MHFFRSAKRSLSLFQSGHNHICLLPSFHDSCFFSSCARRTTFSQEMKSFRGKFGMSRVKQVQLCPRRGGRRSNPRLIRLRLQTVLSQLWVWLNASLLFHLFPLPSASCASHCALPTADVGPTKKTLLPPHGSSLKTLFTTYITIIVAWKWKPSPSYISESIDSLFCSNIPIPHHPMLSIILHLSPARS